MSSDGYDDCWEPFFKLKEKYWPNCPYKTYIVTEGKKCKYAETIISEGCWTTRLREALKLIDNEYVLLMLEDFFIRDYVRQDIIDSIELDKDTAVYNFELSHVADESDWYLKENNTFYMNSCQPSIHNRLKLIERLQSDQSAWEWELTRLNSPYKFYVNNRELIIDIGYYKYNPFGIVRGKWAREVVKFFRKEGIKVNYKKRGFYD